MPFSYDMPSPDASPLEQVITPEGTVATVATPELATALESVITAQTDAVVAVLQSIALVVQQTLAQQAQVIGGAWGALIPIVQAQLNGQRAVLENVQQQIVTSVTQKLSQINEEVGTAAIAAALRQPPPPGMPANPPYVPVPIRPTPPPPMPGGPTPPPPFTPSGPRVPMPTVGGSTPPIQPYTPLAESSPGQTPPVPPGAPFTPPSPTIGSGTPPPAPQGPDDASLPGGGMAPPAGGGVPLPVSGGTGPSGGGGPPGGPEIIPMGGPALPPPGYGPADGYGPSGYPALPPPSPGGGAQPVSIDVEEGNISVTVNVPPTPVSVVVQNTVSATGGTATATATGGAATVVTDGRRLNVAGEEDEKGGGPAPPPPKIKDVECPWRITEGMPPIGGPQWCRLQDAIAAELADLGNGMIGVIMTPIEIVAAGIEISADGGGLTAGFLGGAASLDAARKILGMVTGAARTVRALVTCWRQLVQLAPKCQPGVILGIAVVRGVLSALRNLRLGTDAGVWATVDLAIDLPAIARATGYIMESLCPSIIPSAGEAWAAFAAGAIDEPTWRCWTLADGMDPDLWRPVRESSGRAMTLEQVVFWARLNGDAEDVIKDELYVRGWTRVQDRDIVLHMYDARPTPAQLLQWDVTGALDQRTEDLLRRDEGFVGWWSGDYGRLARAQGLTEEVARYSWRSQQQLPLWQRFIELHPLYWALCADRGGPITEANVRQLLDAGGLAPAAVDWALQTIWRAEDPIHATLTTSIGNSVPNEIYEALRDSGYDGPTAKRVGEAAAADAWRRRALDEGGWTIQAFVAAMHLGIAHTTDSDQWQQAQMLTPRALRRAQHVSGIAGRDAVRRQGMSRAANVTVAASLRAYATGLSTQADAIAAMTGVGYEVKSAAALVAATDLEGATARAARAISTVRRGLLSGALNSLQAGIVLSQAGVLPARRAQLVAAWAIEQVARRPMAAVSQIKKWVGESVMPMTTARQRLINLGWRDPDLTLQLSEMGAALAKASAKAKAKGIAVMSAAAKAADKVKQTALRRLEKAQPVAALGQWYRDGMITSAQVHTRMAAYGYDTHSVDLYIRAWDHQVAKALKTRTSAAAAAPLAPQRQVPISRIRAWYLDGIQTEDWARGRLAGYGYDPDAIDAYIDEWGQQRAARAAKAHPAAPV